MPRVAVGVGGSDRNTGLSGRSVTQPSALVTRCDRNHSPEPGEQASRIAATPRPPPPGAQVETGARAGPVARPPFCAPFFRAGGLAAGARFGPPVAAKG